MIVISALLLGGISVIPGQTQGKSIPSFAGPFLIHCIGVGHCKDSYSGAKSIAFIRLSHFNPAKPFDIQLVSGNVTITEAVDDTWWFNLRLDVRSNNQWKTGAFFFKFPQNGCSQGRENFPKGFALLKGASMTGPCVIPAGVSVYNDTPIYFDFPNFRVMPYGHYKVTFVAGKSKSNKALMCHTVEGKMIPRP